MSPISKKQLRIFVTTCTGSHQIEYLVYVGVEHLDGGEKQSRICKIPAQGGSDPSLTDGSAYVDEQWIYVNSEAVNQKLGYAQTVLNATRWL